MCPRYINLRCSTVSSLHRRQVFILSSVLSLKCIVSSLHRPFLGWPSSLSQAFFVSGVVYSSCPLCINVCSIFMFPLLGVCLQPVLQTCPLFKEINADICNHSDIWYMLCYMFNSICYYCLGLCCCCCSPLMI